MISVLDLNFKLEHLSVMPKDGYPNVSFDKSLKSLKQKKVPDLVPFGQRFKYEF